MLQPRIRSAVPDDGETLRRIDRETWSTLHAVKPPGPAHEPFFDERNTPDAYLVAETDGSVVGYIRLVPPTPLVSNGHVRQIQGLAVARAARGLGLGRALVRAAIAEAGRQGARRITLRVLGHNAPARRLYESEGFTVEGVQPQEFLLDGEYVDDVLMGRAL
ncbi:GNAT family N-acetyltransferase [Streptomyces beihaiensis]|uniref:GNAT family N-acetyltransferase n=1 Tax=Streptomyces beihaiensis TaxID=2984495 RepID=A0ABT3TSR9_9ACTN|nr:GNAT family N-acetyltransferase [Streptomyces beihaiensis]MCX3060078.1 GNAT family N-acetyltransferase [Streptomyces beihaiensis]